MGVWPCGRVGVCLVVGWAMRSVQKTRVKLFRLSFSTGGSSRKVESHRSSPHRTHTHTATRPHTHIRYHTAVSHMALTLAWLSLLLLLAASQRGAFLVPLASSVYRTTAATRGIDPMLPTTAAPAVALAALGLVQLHESSFGGFRLSPKPPTRWNEGSPSRCSRRNREAQSCQPISTAVQQYSLTRTASRKSTKTIKSARLTTRRRTGRIRSKKISRRKRPFSTGGIRLCKNGLSQSKKSVENVFLNPSCRSPHHKTHPHAHTSIAGEVPHSSIMQQRRRCLGCYHCCCFSPQISVAHC